MANVKNYLVVINNAKVSKSGRLGFWTWWKMLSKKSLYLKKADLDISFCFVPHPSLLNADGRMRLSLAFYQMMDVEKTPMLYIPPDDVVSAKKDVDLYLQQLCVSISAIPMQA